MFRFHCLYLILASVCATGAVMPAAARAQGANTVEIILGNGPHAGTYTLPAANTICIHAQKRKQFSAAYKDVKAREPNTLSGAGINVFNPEAAGPKQGQINIRFGDPDDEHPAAYEVAIPRDSQGPLTLTRQGKRVELAFEGQTKNGTKLRVTAKCGDIDEL